MNKRVWSIAVALAMLLSMVCSAFAVPAADESVSEGDALDATVQLNNNASEQPALLNTENGSALTSVVMTSSDDHFSVDDEFVVSASLENYNGDWAIFSAALTYDPQELEYLGFTSKLGDTFTLTVDDSDKANGSLTVWMMSNEGTNIPAVDGSAALMDLQFKAIGETDSADLTFTLADESVAGYVDSDSDGIADEPEFIDSGAYTATSVFEPVIRVYRPYLTMRLVDETGNAVTEIVQGQKVKAIVSLKQYYPDESWTMMSLDLQFNGNKFEYDLDTLVNYGNLVDSEGTAVTMLPAETEDPAKPLSICFFSSDLNNMVLKDGANEADILELTLTATGAGSALEIGASFLQEGNLKYDAETGTEEVLIPAEDYIEEHEEGTAEIKVTQNVFPYLSVEADKTLLARGDAFTLKVNITDYVDPFSMMSILVDFGADAYELDTEKAIVAFGGSAAVVPEIIGNKLGITIFSEDGNDLKLSGGYTSGTVLEIPLKVKSDYEGTGSDISVSFLEGGNLFGDEAAGYIETPAVQTITVQGRPELSIRIDQIDGVTVPDGEEITSIEQGKEVRFVVSVKDFTSAWEIMTLKMAFDSAAFELVSVEDLEPFDVTAEDAHSEFIYESSADTLLACWFNGDPLGMISEDRDVMAFTLKVKQEDLTAKQLLQTVSAAFLEGGNYANDNMLTGESYTETPAEVEFTIIEVASEVLVNITWGAMEFTYNFGEWSTEHLIWEGRGWSVTSDADKTITVTNQGGVNITASFVFNAETAMGALAGTFKKQDGTEIESLDVTAGNAESVLFDLGELPADVTLQEGTTALGTITITIDKADS